MNALLIKNKKTYIQWCIAFLLGVISSLSVFWLILYLNISSLFPVLSNINFILPTCILFSFSLIIIFSWINRDTRPDKAKKLLNSGNLNDAWEIFQECKKNKKIMPVLHQLAVEFQNKQQPDKALQVYEYIAEINPDFRDVREQIKRNKAMQGTMVYGMEHSSSHTTLFDGNETPTLGRYEIEKELGKGAMGTVYLGKDPRINRTVAIKTLALSEEFEESEIDNVKSRFFREAETAGRLIHPNIVTVYDAGEEHDLAYIAMEYLDGHDLIRYTKAEKLLPIKTALQLIILAAEALNYAHKQKIVHRDIKPANVMLIPAASTIKLTDFGIARITDSSKTKTGMVLGTPSYMSPEQLVGQHIDGRSDLFSLGVMLFQLLTGQLPFKGDSMAALMFSIANERHPEIIQFRKGLKQVSSEINAIMDKVLEKTPQKRYQKGEELARDLRNCLKNIKKNN